MRFVLFVPALVVAGMGSAYASTLSLRDFLELANAAQTPHELFRRQMGSSQVVDVMGCPLNQFFCKANSGCCQPGEVCCKFGCCSQGSKCNDEKKICENDGEPAKGTKCFAGNYACGIADSPEGKCCPRNRVCQGNKCVKPESTLTSLPAKTTLAAPTPTPPPAPSPEPSNPSPPAPDVNNISANGIEVDNQPSPTPTPTGRIPNGINVEGSDRSTTTTSTPTPSASNQSPYPTSKESLEQNDEVTQKRNKSGIIIGGVLAGIALVVICILLFALYRCYKRDKPRPESNIFVSADFSSVDGGPSPPDSMRKSHFEILKRKSSILRLTLTRKPTMKSAFSHDTDSVFAVEEKPRMKGAMHDWSQTAERAARGKRNSDESIVVGWTRSLFAKR